MKASLPADYFVTLRNWLNWERKQLFIFTLPSSEECFALIKFPIAFKFDSTPNIWVIKRITLLLYLVSYCLTLNFAFQVSILASCGKEWKFLLHNSLKSNNSLADTNLILLLCSTHTHTQKKFSRSFGWCDFWLCFKLLIMVERGEGFSDENSTLFNSLSQNQFLPFFLCSCGVLKVKKLGKNSPPKKHVSL